MWGGVEVKSPHIPFPLSVQTADVAFLLHFGLVFFHTLQLFVYLLQVIVQCCIVIERKAVLHGKVGIGKSIPRSGSIKWACSPLCWFYIKSFSYIGLFFTFIVFVVTSNNIRLFWKSRSIQPLWRIFSVVIHNSRGESIRAIASVSDKAMSSSWVENRIHFPSSWASRARSVHSS